MISSRCAPPASRPKRPASWWRRSWTHSGCGCTPRRPGSCTSPEAPKGSTFSASSIECKSRGGGGVVGICRSGRPSGRWPRSEARSATGRTAATRGCRWKDAVENLNHVVRGWGNYFRYGNSGEKFSQIDSYVHERLAILASAKHGLAGRNWVTRFDHEWCSQTRRLSPVRNGPTHDCVCQSVNDVGEPCAGEPHARCARDMTSSSGVRVPCGG